MGGTVGPEPIDERAPVRVLYIAGSGRSGSTLLARILGQIQGVFNAGEVRYLWERGLLANRLCGCGRHFNDCPVWRGILEDAGPVEPQEMSRVQSGLTRVRRLPIVALGHHVDNRAEVGAYYEALGRVYRAIAQVSGCDVVVDSSKLPSYGRLLGSIPGIELFVVHLVRDPRSAAGSWMSIKDQPDRGVPGTMQRLSPLRSALLWDLWNGISRYLVEPASTRYLTLRYEDFVEQPRRAVLRIAEMIGKGSAELPFSDATTVELRTNHTVAGNPDRLNHGIVTISKASGTSKQLSRSDELLVTAVTLPILVRFGYPLKYHSNGTGPRPIGIQHLPEPVRTWRRLQRHWRWARQDGVGRLVEEDQLDLRARLAAAARRRSWRRQHRIEPRSATPVLLVGLQRSGTNMVARALEASPEFEIRNENDRAAFTRFRLRPLPEVREVVLRSRQRFVLFKPLIDSHRVDELLDTLTTPSPGMALWTYRSVDGRSRSALSKFGDHDLQVVRAIADGKAADVWQGQRLSEESLGFVRSVDLDRASSATAAALIWYLRNSLYFDLDLETRHDCTLISYDRLLDDPEHELRRICSFLGAEFEPAMAAGIGRRGGSLAKLELDPMVRQRCDELESRLEAAWSSLATV